MKKFKLIAAAALALSSAQAKASDWVDAGTNTSGDHFWYDRSAIIKDKTRAVTWIRSTSGDGSYFLSRVFFQCDTRMFRILSMVVYEKGGKNTSVDPNMAFDSVPPDSMYDRILKEVCPDSMLYM